MDGGAASKPVEMCCRMLIIFSPFCLIYFMLSRVWRAMYLRFFGLHLLIATRARSSDDYRSSVHTVELQAITGKYREVTSTSSNEGVTWSQRTRPMDHLRLRDAFKRCWPFLWRNKDHLSRYHSKVLQLVWCATCPCLRYN